MIKRNIKDTAIWSGEAHLTDFMALWRKERLYIEGKRNYTTLSSSLLSVFYNKILGTLPNTPSQQLAHTDENIPVFHEYTAPYSVRHVVSQSAVISQLSSATDHLAADLCFFQFLYHICLDTDLYFIIAIYCHCDSLLLFVIIIKSTQSRSKDSVLIYHISKSKGHSQNYNWVQF